MMREFIVTVYLTIVKILSSIYVLFPIQNKVTFVMSYGENHFFIYEEMNRQNIDCEIIFLYKSTCKYNLSEFSHVKRYKFESLNLIHMVKAIYHLSTSKYIIVDNYFGTLSAIYLKEGVQCIQLWHAAGAIKKFGLLAPSFKQRSLRSQRRFLKVYDAFHKVVVGSDSLATIYKRAFGLSDDRILRTGIPRTDLFFNEKSKERIKKEIVSKNLKLGDKKIILYAPTFRNENMGNFGFCLDVENMYRALKDEYVLIVRLHPAIRNKLKYNEKYRGFLYDYSSYPNVNELFLITDILITDYSSIPFEFCLLGKQMIFFAYDLSDYVQKNGIIGNYISNIPGPIVYNTDEIISEIKSGTLEINKINTFANEWNQYSRGNASKNFVNAIFKDNAFRSVKNEKG
ncbi:CDP-glycerol glycerophosphotransferase family protein [Bacillus cytotoxicus]|uniref:CDP-glycerol glycerophosphotransferase family protein n=1 Tax=Bacillus cytotoxicus TaxID=580165 RepID=UPI00086463A4|nr:CDP-glycerol glycerophosphotransferase family protein [Bacillus cytotoxicus]AWC30559.1 CDP-glycerol--glycerophosphate glycerophosphotransferase [Bacillus cytotoxicus]AWC42702.1 CDP-glycerol--glycerophosphate glycerophosphotransferase [Bacillus cytotoxicus]AWC50633.1 CDP-glycerol--glycerophosphate glycerophosphotransferase [Bacillus cytotoxicus]AWC54687.1 CDP-glycerol--glycerophosphate glycerophosphotransferase [Bacillus cytotoxicus]AWC58810.1 CDP-glycerol--glycerophosphate glycerophosphotra